MSTTEIVELGLENLRVATLVNLEAESSTFFYTDCDIPIGSTPFYKPKSMKIDGINYSSTQIVQNVSITFDDIDKSLLSFLSNIGNKQVIVSISVAILNEVNTLAQTRLLFKGTLSGWEYQRASVKINVTSLLEQWRRSTAKLYSVSCRWTKFGGVECGLSAPLPAESCDRTYDQCVSFSNESNFGGFRWLPSLVTQEIWWGVTPKD